MPPQLKSLCPYLLQAELLDTKDPLMAYFVRMFALQKGVQSTKEGRDGPTRNALAELMAQQEAAKDDLSSVLQAKPSSEFQPYVEAFAVRVFSHCTKEENTVQDPSSLLALAKSFHAASLFFDTATQWSPLSPKLSELQKYAKYRAASLSKEARQGPSLQFPSVPSLADFPSPPGTKEISGTPRSVQLERIRKDCLEAVDCLDRDAVKAALMLLQGAVDSLKRIDTG